MLRGKVVRYTYRWHGKRVQEIDEMAFADLGPDIPPYPESWWRSVQGYVFQLEKPAKKIVGYAVYNMKKENPCQDPKKKVMYVELVGVDPKYQGQGVGTQLLSRIGELADKNGAICIVELLVEAKKEQNIRFYRKNGYRVSKYREIEENYDEEGRYTGDYVLMIRDPKHECALPTCSKVGVFICTGCRNTYYCSIGHGKQNWEVNHQRECD